MKAKNLKNLKNIGRSRTSKKRQEKSDVMQTIAEIEVDETESDVFTYRNQGSANVKTNSKMKATERTMT